MAEDKEYLDLDGLEEYHSKLNDEFKELTIEEIEEAFQDMDETDPLYSVVYELISKANEAAELAKESATSAAESLSKMAKPATHETDGLMSAADKIRLDEINDITTGINLIRGSRDWKIHTKLSEFNSSVPEDGFRITSTNNTFSFIKEDGFTIVDSPQANTASIYGNQIRSVEPGKAYTISLDIRFIGSVPTERFQAFGLHFYNGSTFVQAFNFYLETADLTEFKAGEWKRITKTVIAPSTIAAENGYALSIFFFNTNNHRQYRAPAINPGSINNAEWSPAPADLVVGPVNDITTGINLLRGTRDFTLGSNRIYQNSGNYMSDGFNTLDSWNITTDDDSFTVLSISRNGLTSDNVRTVIASAVRCKVGDVFTFSCEFMSSDIDSIDGGVFISPTVTPDTDITVLQSNLGFSKDDVENYENGKWTKLVIPMTITAAEAAYLNIRLRLGRNGDLNFRKLCLYKGHIENPEWSASPFDIDYINNITTAPNLLRGTRDFVQGSSLYAGSRYIDGFLRSASFIYSIDNEGFVNAQLSSGPTSTAVYLNSSVISGDFAVGDKITIFGEFKVQGSISNIVTNSLFTICSMSKSGTNTNLISPNFASLGLDKNTVPSNTWVPFKYIYAIGKEVNFNDEALYVTFFSQLAANSSTTIAFRKLGIYKGYVENPEWSASPFDVAQQSDMLARTRYDVLNKVTASSNVTISTAIMRVNNVFAQLYIVATPKQTLTANTEYTFATLDSSIWPVLNAGLVGRVNGACGCVGYITSDSGAVRGAFPTNVDTSKSINLCATYLLNDKFPSASTLELPAGEVPVTLPTID